MATMSASFVAKRNQGIDAQRATGGDVTRHQRDRRKQNRDGDKGCGVGGTDAIDHVGHETCQRESRGHAEQQAKRGEAKAVRKYEPQDIVSSRAKGDTDADFARALRDAVGHYSVDADSYQDQRERGEERKKQEIQALGAEGKGRHFFNGPTARNGKTLVYGPDTNPNEGRTRGR